MFFIFPWTFGDYCLDPGSNSVLVSLKNWCREGSCEKWNSGKFWLSWNWFWMIMTVFCRVKTSWILQNKCYQPLKIQQKHKTCNVFFVYNKIVEKKFLHFFCRIKKILDSTILHLFCRKKGLAATAKGVKLDVNDFV